MRSNGTDIRRDQTGSELGKGSCYLKTVCCSKIEIQYENNYEKGLLDGIGKAIEIVKEGGTDGR